MTNDLHASAHQTLTVWTPAGNEHRALREAFLGMIEAREDVVRRGCQAGHLTASAMVLSPDGRQVCLAHHKIVQAWLQPGGHLEDDASLPAAALREATEETGLAGLAIDPVPIGLDVHAITCRGSGPTRHFDVRFLAVAPLADPVVSEESHDVRWWDVDALPELFDEVRELVRLARERLASGSPAGGLASPSSQVATGIVEPTP